MTPDYTALETELRWWAQDLDLRSKPRMVEFLRRTADALSHAASLQAEIERLKGAMSELGCRDCNETIRVLRKYGLSPETGAT